ncbi:MAG TPA: hypothetical protein VGR57_04630 [Ktedonobacterales bacterium]|nr:hypothetical protein [Ktedonobacterales bacterium]
MSTEHGHPVQRLLQSADARLLATAHTLAALALAAPRGMRAELDREHLRALWPRVADGALAFMILGGVIAVPAACAFALLTGLLPASAPLRMATPQLFGLAVLWFLGAIIGAHFQPRRAS